jgi:capsular polysaccharide transport system permease protein
VFSGLLIALFTITFVLPLAGCIAYYGFIASPGFASEVRFVVRSSTPFLSRDRYSEGMIEPKEKIVQDTAILLNYLESPAIVGDLQKATNLSGIYGRPQIDFLSRLPADATQDKILSYWKKHFSARVSPKSGIVELEVVAYSPREAVDLVKLVLRLAEAQVNNLNAGMWNELRASTERDVDQASKEVADLRGKLRDTQNQTGVFDVQLSAQSLANVQTSVETELADLKSKQTALRKSVGQNNPQLAEITRRIAALEDQAGTLRAQSAGTTTTSDGNLAEYSSIFDQLNLDLSLAEARLKSALKELEKVKLVSSMQLVYVDNFTDPTQPEINKYPNVPLSLFLAFIACLGLCGLVCGGVMLIRQKLD